MGRLPDKNGFPLDSKTPEATSGLNDKLGMSRALDHLASVELLLGGSINEQAMAEMKCLREAVEDLEKWQSELDRATRSSGFKTINEYVAYHKMLSIHNKLRETLRMIRDAPEERLRMCAKHAADALEECDRIWDA